MALSGYSGANWCGSKSQACTRSFMREMARRALSALRLSVMSQPVSMASDPKPSDWRRKARRVGRSSRRAASLMRSFVSTAARRCMRVMTDSSTSPQHRQQAARNEQRHGDMDEDEQGDRRHGQEMHDAGALIAAEDSRERLQLHGLPDGEAGEHDDDERQDDADIEGALHHVVGREVGVREPAAERRGDIA